jgi:hypothetical protein
MTRLRALDIEAVIAFVGEAQAIDRGSAAKLGFAEKEGRNIDDLAGLPAWP